MDTPEENPKIEFKKKDINSILNSIQNYIFNLNRKSFFILVTIVLTFFVVYISLSAPKDFPVGTIVNISQGENLRQVSLKLKENNVVRSRLLFEIFTILYGGEKHLVSADYLFENRISVYEVARRISKGERHLAPVKITIPEGFNIKDIAEASTLRLSNFHKDKFLLEAQNIEGYLFPDTYFFFTTDGEKEVLKSMRDNFEKKVGPLRPKIFSSGKTEKDIIIMASLVEGEAKGENDRSFISGILWRRIKMNMPLQVDVAPETYKQKGLPKNPVGNPGLKAIESAIYPKSSSYLYYLHDKGGNIHYARTFTEHKQNIAKYLK